MGNSQGHSNEVETVKEEKETPSCCELKRRKSKSKGVSPDEQDGEETREELSLGNALKNSFDNVSLNSDSNDGLTQHVAEVNVASYVASDDRPKNSSPQQDITNSESNDIDKCDSTFKVKLDSDVSDSLECLYKCGDGQASNVNDATNEKEGTVASNQESSKRPITNDAFNSSLLREKKTKQVESGVPVQSVLQLLENIGNLEQESVTVSCNRDHICHASVIMPETINTSTPVMINTHHMSCLIKSPEAPDSSLTFKSAMDCLDGGGKPQATVQLENPGAYNVECTAPDSTAKHSKVNSANECLDFVRKPTAAVQLEKRGSCNVELAALESTATHSKAEDNLSSDAKREIVKSSCESGEVEETELWKVTPDETCEKDTFANMIKAQDGKGEEEFVVVETDSYMCPIKEDISIVHQKRLESQDVILNYSIKEPDKQISQETIYDRSYENHSVQSGILSIDSAIIKSDKSVSTVNESDNTQQEEKESVIQKNDENVIPLEGNGFSEKQDSDSLKEFEETELLCLYEVEESNVVVKNENKADIGQPAISGLADTETMLSHHVLRSRDEPNAEVNSIKPSLNDSAKLQSGSKLQYSCPILENMIKHKAIKEGEFRDMDQDCKNWEDSSREMQYRIDSNASNEEQFRREKDGSCSQEVDKLKVAKSDESEDGTVPPPTPSSMAIWREEEEEKLGEEGEVSSEETHKGQIKQMVSEFGDIVCRRLSLLLESQTLLSISDGDDIPVCENVFLASGMDKNEREYREDITKQNKDVTELKDEINSLLNAGKETLVGLIDVDSVIENSKQTDEEVINLSEIFPKLDEKITVDMKEIRVKHDKRFYLGEEVPACINNLSHSESASERSGGDGNLDYVVSAGKARSFDDRDKCLLSEHVQQDLEVKDIDEEISESTDIQATSSTGAENKHNYLLGNDEEDVVEVMDALDDVIDEAYSQVFTTEKEKRFLEAEVELNTTHTTDQTEDEHDTKSLKMNEIDPTKNERKEHHEDKLTKKTLNPAALMSVSVKSSKYQESCDNVDSIADDSWTLAMERDLAFSLNTLTLVDSNTMQHDFRHVESSRDDASMTPLEQEPTLSLKIQQMEEEYSRAQTVDELGDRTPTAESFPELTALTGLASAAVDNLVQHQPSGRLSVSHTESDLDISEQRDDLSTEGMYADDEDDETMEILFTRTYTEPKQGTEAFVSCTVVNSAYRQANRDGSFLKYAVPETLDLLEGSIEVMPPSFIKAKKEMRDIQVHLQSLRKQMEHFHDDIDESSLPDLDYLTPDPQPRRAITD